MFNDLKLKYQILEKLQNSILHPKQMNKPLKHPLEWCSPPTSKIDS